MDEGLEAAALGFRFTPLSLRAIRRDDRLELAASAWAQRAGGGQGANLALPPLKERLSMSRSPLSARLQLPADLDGGRDALADELICAAAGRERTPFR